MDIAEWATAFFTAVIAVTGCWALIYAKSQLKQAREADRVQHLLRFVELFETEPLVSNRKGMAAKRLKDVREPPELDNILNFFETIGMLVKRGYLDEHDVWSSFSYWMFNIFADARESIEQEQKEDPTFYSDFSALMKRMSNIEAAEHGLADRPSQEEIKEFWQYELELTSGLPAARRRPRRSAKKA